ncbi:MAG: ABC transporter ATP-binding protein [Deltaproteobacteria bacterium]|nr:ABC transporter ATP-binding protein [Deltaproteobacteria bacterium]
MASNHKSENGKGRNPDLKATARQLAVYILRNRRIYLLWAVTTLGYIAALVLIPILVGSAIAAVEQGLPRQEVFLRCLWIFGAAVLRLGLRFYSRTMVFNGAREVEYEIRNDLFAHFQRLPQSYFGRQTTGDLMSRCVNDLQSVRLLLGPGLLNLLQTPILLTAVFVAMFSINAKLALLSLLPFPIFIWLARTVAKNLHHWNVAAQEGLAELSSQLQETISGIAVVKSCAMEPMTQARFAEANEEFYRRQLSLVRVNSALPTTAMALPALAMWIVLLMGGRDVMAGEMQISAFFTFAMYVYELTFPTFILGWVVALVQRGAAAMQRLNEVLTVDPSVADAPDATPVENLRGELEFRNVSFCYPNQEGTPALQSVSVHVPAGKTLGIVGPVGSGKTTLASLIPRLSQIEDGQLLIDGVDVNQIPLKQLRSAIAMVPQDAFLFSMSLAENIAYGLPDVDRAAVSEAARRAHLLSDVAELPEGFDTLVGERGVMLSGGQRQRAALARALALDPQILILDDTLSSVDAETEAAILHELREVYRGRTVVVITHRVSAVAEADEIIVLDAGKIVQHGRHEELLAEGGLYARLAQEEALEEGRV